MTNKEAIEYIKKTCYGDWCEETWREAMDAAVSALQADWNEMLVICDNCGHAIHVKKEDE